MPCSLTATRASATRNEALPPAPHPGRAAKPTDRPTLAARPACDASHGVMRSARILLTVASIGLVAAASTAAPAQAKATKCPHRAGHLMKEGVQSRWKTEWGTGVVITDFCYDDGRITWRRTVTRAVSDNSRVRFPDEGYIIYPPRLRDWSSGTGCDTAQRVCRTRAEFDGYLLTEVTPAQLNPALLGKLFRGAVCVDTKIYGDGKHRRKVTKGVCAPASTPATAPPAQPSILAPGETLTANQYVDASNGQYRLWMSPNGNLVLYAGARVLWSTQTHGNPGARAVQQVQGNLVVYSPSHVALWTNRTWDYPGATLHVQPDGNLVTYHSDRPIWSTGTVNNALLPGETLRAGQYLTSSNGRYRLQQNPDGNLVLYRLPDWQPLWDTKTWGNPGARAVLQAQGNLVVYNPSSAALWTNRTWDYPGATLHVQPDGNVVLYHYTRPIWATNTHQPATGTQ